MTDYLLNVALPRCAIPICGEVDTGRDAVLRLLRAELQVFDVATAHAMGATFIPWIVEKGNGRASMLREDRTLLAITGALPSEVWA